MFEWIAGTAPLSSASTSFNTFDSLTLRLICSRRSMPYILASLRAAAKALDALRLRASASGHFCKPRLRLTCHAYQLVSPSGSPSPCPNDDIAAMQRRKPVSTILAKTTKRRRTRRFNSQQRSLRPNRSPQRQNSVPCPSLYPLRGTVSTCHPCPNIPKRLLQHRSVSYDDCSAVSLRQLYLETSPLF